MFSFPSLVSPSVDLSEYLEISQASSPTVLSGENRRQ
jgi:hypothetical protein